MVTRRDMIGLAAAGLAGTALESQCAITRSAQALRGAMMVGGKNWQNPYVTDGLVAMWDGEWNAGGGVHDASASEWTDLTGNGFDFILGTDSYFETDSLHCAKYKAAACVKDLPSMRTIELLIKQDQSIDYHYVFNSDAAYSSSYHRAIWIDTTNKTVVCGQNQKGFSYTASHGTTWHLVFVYDDLNETPRPSRCYLDGDLLGDSEYSTGGGANYPMLNPHANNYSVAMRTYAFRLYNRALTSAEIAANYAVDAARFNI